MAKIKRKLDDLPILTAFVSLSVVFLLLAFILSSLEKTLLQNVQHEIVFRYSKTVEGFNSQKVWGNQSVFRLSERDSALVWLCEMGIWIFPPVTYLSCCFLSGLLFFRSKLQKPLALLSGASHRIAGHDLDFSLRYPKNDEMGTLCAAFEEMRSALESNNREMWRQMKERRQLNAAFSHDLRTPLTVLEGHLDILQKYTPEGKLSVRDTLDTYAVMAGQVERLKSYVLSMNTLQRLEDIPVSRKPIPVSDFLKQLNDTAAMVCKGKRLIFSQDITAAEIRVDPEIVWQVFENLLSNAARYADSSVSIRYSTDGGAFSIQVTDDGKGFDEAHIHLAVLPFYTTEKKQTASHLGLGLNICKILCERHNGSLLLSNGAKRGAAVIARFGMSE